MNVETLERRIREVPDFPKPGILFRDITPLLADAAALKAATSHLAQPFADEGIERVLGIESRGFILGALVAAELNAGFVPVRKAGKLPHDVLSESYSLEYGTDSVELHADALRPGMRVLVVDDLIATGGTARAAATLAERAGASVRGLSFLIELEALGGRQQLGNRRIHSVLRY